LSTNNGDLYPSGKTGYEMFYTDLQGYWRELYNPDAMKSTQTGPYVEEKISETKSGMFSKETGWNQNVLSNPAVLDFWFDFMDVSGEIG
jgi:hypothetical protein